MNLKKPLPKRLFKLLQALILRCIYNQSLHRKVNNLNSDDRAFPEKKFIEELSKEPIPESICSNFCKLVFYEALPHQRNLHKMVNYLYEMKKFKKFIAFNSIDKNSLYLISNTVTKCSFQQGNFIFKANDLPDYFYGIITGEISIRKSLEQRTKEEGEIVRLKSGDYFGEWGLLEEKRRTASAYAFTDVILFKMTPKAFTQTLMKCMKKAEYERRLFIKKKLPSLANEKLIDQLYKSLIRLMLRKGKVLYRQGDIAQSIYLIYEGSVQIKSNSSQVPVLFSSVGDFLGLETINGFNQTNSRNVYNETVVTHDEFNIIFKFSSVLLQKQYKGHLAEFFQHLLLQKNLIVNDFLTKKSLFERKTRISFNQIKEEDKVSPTIDLIKNLLNPFKRRANPDRSVLNKVSSHKTPINLRFNNDCFKSMRKKVFSVLNQSSSEAEMKKIKGRNTNFKEYSLGKSLVNKDDGLNSRSLLSFQTVKGHFDFRSKIGLMKKKSENEFTSIMTISKSQSQGMIDVKKINISSSTLFFKSLHTFNDRTMKKPLFNSGSISLPLVSWSKQSIK